MLVSTFMGDGGGGKYKSMNNALWRRVQYGWGQFVEHWNKRRWTKSFWLHVSTCRSRDILAQSPYSKGPSTMAQKLFSHRSLCGTKAKLYEICEKIFYSFFFFNSLKENKLGDVDTCITKVRLKWWVHSCLFLLKKVKKVREKERKKWIKLHLAVSVPVLPMPVPLASHSVPIPLGAEGALPVATWHPSSAASFVPVLTVGTLSVAVTISIALSVPVALSMVPVAWALPLTRTMPFSGGTWQKRKCHLVEPQSDNLHRVYITLIMLLHCHTNTQVPWAVGLALNR